MADIFSLVLVMYITTMGLALIVDGPRGAKRVNRIWLRIVTGVIGWILNLLGDALKALGKKVRR